MHYISLSNVLRQIFCLLSTFCLARDITKCSIWLSDKKIISSDGCARLGTNQKIGGKLGGGDSKLGEGGGDSKFHVE